MIHYDRHAVHDALTHPHGPPGLPATMERIVADKHAAQSQVPCLVYDEDIERADDRRLP